MPRGKIVNLSDSKHISLAIYFWTLKDSQGLLGKKFNKNSITQRKRSGNSAFFLPSVESDQRGLARDKAMTLGDTGHEPADDSPVLNEHSGT